jgi:hypothetical protein
MEEKTCIKPYGLFLQRKHYLFVCAGNLEPSSTFDCVDL